MADQPNERTDDNTKPGTDAEDGPLPNGGVDTGRKKSRPSVRWVQLAYDLEQYGDANPDERREVY